MRFLNKYKIYSTKNCSLRKLPLRINDFKRPKWEIIKKKLVIHVKKHTWKTNNKYKPQLNDKKAPFLNKYRLKFNKKNFRNNRYQAKFLDFAKEQALLFNQKDFIS